MERKPDPDRRQIRTENQKTTKDKFGSTTRFGSNTNAERKPDSDQRQSGIKDKFGTKIR